MLETVCALIFHSEIRITVSPRQSNASQVGQRSPPPDEASKQEKGKEKKWLLMVCYSRDSWTDRFLGLGVRRSPRTPLLGHRTVGLRDQPAGETARLLFPDRPSR